MTAPTYFATKKGLITQPLAESNADDPPDFFWVNRLAYFINILQSPFRIHLPGKVGIVVDRLDSRKSFQSCIKSCATHTQATRGLFSGKHSFFLHRLSILVKLIILIDKTNVKTYNTTWTSKT